MRLVVCSSVVSPALTLRACDFPPELTLRQMGEPSDCMCSQLDNQGTATLAGVYLEVSAAFGDGQSA